MVKIEKYQSPFAIPPGDTLKELINDHNMTQKEVCSRIGLTTKHLSQIVTGKAPITEETALKLEYIFEGVSANFWLNLEINYRETLARLEAEKSLENDIEKSRLIPYLDLANHGLIKKTRNVTEKVKNLRKFFAVSELRNILDVYEGVVAYRRVAETEEGKYALASWLRIGELKAGKIEVASIDKKLLKKKIPEIRGLTLMKEINEAIIKAGEILSECGVALVIVPHLKKTYVHGATKWLNDEKIMIEISFRNKYIDTFWFDLFHEIGHILKHSKKEIYIQDKENVEYDNEYSEDEKEKEADEFAREILIPCKVYNEFIRRKNFTPRSIEQFADSIKISPNIVIARLLFEKKVEYNKTYQNMRPRIKFTN